MVFESVVEACDFGLNVLAVVMIRIYDGKSQSFIAQMLEYLSAVPTPYLAYLELQLELQASSSRKEECCSEAHGLCEASFDRLGG